jgi:hypothetical protein
MLFNCKAPTLQAPIITLSNLYSLVERMLRAEYLVGTEKFFKVGVKKKLACIRIMHSHHFAFI